MVAEAIAYPRPRLSWQRQQAGGGPGKERRVGCRKQGRNGAEWPLTAAEAATVASPVGQELRRPMGKARGKQRETAHVASPSLIPV